jgi:diacylglycerol O-acyltransferase
VVIAASVAGVHGHPADIVTLPAAITGRPCQVRAPEGRVREMQGAQKLTPLDASFLHLETPRTHMHIGGVAIFEPSPLGTGRALYDGLVRAIAPRLDLMPRYRQKLAFVPLSLDTPVWVDDPDFDISQHLLRAALPKPGGDGELKDLIGRIFSRPLDRRRPLWELFIVEGLRDGRWALISKSHHSMVDGVSSLELTTILLDAEREPSRQPFGVSRWEARESPSGFGLLVNSLRQRVTRPARVLSAARAVAGQPGRLANALRDTASGLVSMAEHMGAPKSAINGDTGPARGFSYSRFPLDDFRAVKAVFGGTINDIVLAAVAGGLRHFLVARGVDPDDENEALEALCPVSIRDTSERAALGNRLAMLLVKLPIGEADPARRLAAVRATVDRLKARKQAVGADFLLNLAGFAPSTLHAMVARASLRQISFNLIVTNVPGPQFPLYCQEAQLLEVFPIAFLYDGQQVAVAIFSYLGTLNFGYLVDADGVRDVEIFAGCVEEGLRELVDAAREAADFKGRRRTAGSASAAPQPAGRRPSRASSNGSAIRKEKTAPRVERATARRASPRRRAD